MSVPTKATTLRGRIDGPAVGLKPSARRMPLGFVLAAFVVGNIVNPLCERTIIPLYATWSAARNEHDAAFIREFNTGLSGPQALQQPYLIAYFAREYKLAEQTTQNVQNRCSVAQTILTYAQDPSIAGHAAILYAMPPSVADDIASARQRATQPGFLRMFAQDTSCFLRIAATLERVKPGFLLAEATADKSIPGGATVPVPQARIVHSNAAPVPAPPAPIIQSNEDAFVPQIAQAPAPTPAGASTDDGTWLYAPTPGSVVGNQLIKITLQNTEHGRRAIIHNTALSGNRGRTVQVELACVGCPPQLNLDKNRTIFVPSVAAPSIQTGERTLDIPTSLPITIRFRAHEIR